MGDQPPGASIPVWFGPIEVVSAYREAGPQYAAIALQLVRAGSSIGAHLEEADVAASRRDMALKQAVGLREARESKHWLRMLLAEEVLVDDLRPLFQESGELVAMLTASVKKLRDDG